MAGESKPSCNIRITGPKPNPHASTRQSPRITRQPMIPWAHKPVVLLANCLTWPFFNPAEVEISKYSRASDLFAYLRGVFSGSSRAPLFMWMNTSVSYKLHCESHMSIFNSRHQVVPLKLDNTTQRLGPPASVVVIANSISNTKPQPAYPASSKSSISKHP